MATKKAQKKSVSKRRKATTVRKKTAPRAKAATSDVLDSVSTSELRAQLRARERTVRSLQRRRERILAQISEIDHELMRHGTIVPGIGGKRPKNDRNLRDALAEALKGKELRVNDAVRAVIEGGYKTTAENFRTIVNQKLISDKRFKKVKRGVYTA